MENPVIMDTSTWAEVLSFLLSGLNYLDSIVLFDTEGCHLTFLGFDIALMCFGIVWNAAGLWSYNFDSVYFDSPGEPDSDSHSFPMFNDDPEPPDPDVYINIGDDDDFE